MKKILYTLSLLLISSTVFAFGGSGGTEMIKDEDAGFDALGLHFGPDGQATVDFTPGSFWCKAGKISQCLQQLKKYYPDMYHCATNADCKKNKFCKIDGESNMPESSTCVDVSSLTSTQIGLEGKRYLECTTGNCRTNRWTARNWCAANNMHLVNFADLKINASKRTPACKESDDDLINWDRLSKLLKDAHYWHVDNSYDADHVFLIRYDPDNQDLKEKKCIYAEPYSAKVYILCTD